MCEKIWRFFIVANKTGYSFIKPCSSITFKLKYREYLYYLKLSILFHEIIFKFKIFDLIGDIVRVTDVLL